MSMGFTTADLANLKAALVSGALEVTIGDRTVKYRSQKDLIATIAMVQAELEGDSPATTSKIIQATYNKGRSE